MSNILVSTETMTREDWLKWRNKGIGGSDTSVICGLNPYKSQVELWMEKTGRIDPKEAGEAAYWGTLIEPLIRNEFNIRSGLEVGLELSILQHPIYPFMLANVDGIVIDPVHGGCIFEAKTASQYKLNVWEQGVPEEYQLQVQHYMAVTGFNGAYVAALVGGNRFIWHYVGRDNEVIDLLIKLEERFWSYVEKDTPPPMDGSEAASKLLDKLYPRSKAKSSIILPDEAMILVQQYEEAQEQEKKAAERKEEAANRLKELLKDNESGTIGERVITWKLVESERLDTRKLKAEMPEVYTRYANKSAYRRFSIK
jgi:putative phage-type endonuclease